MLMPIMVVEQENKTGVTLTKKVIKIPPDPRAFEMMHQMDVMLSQMWVMQPRGMSTKGDRMGFIDRVMNVVDVVLGQMFFTYTFVEEIKLFRKKFGHNFKGYEVIHNDELS
ncbi:unnamed protein product [Heligmosomoides polygyrus]|uniref:Ty3-gypsy retrotransposon protein n=1 Tax=Heligmosomoides polygyrus TaxID=6339 RepID=A0A183GCA8_HELPZ|nr:unnamed protein product [Heligmosomoides polygyrus]